MDGGQSHPECRTSASSRRATLSEDAGQQRLRAISLRHKLM